MTTETQTARLPLAEAAKQATIREAEQALAGAEHLRQRYERDATAAGPRVAAKVLGASYGEGVEWTAEGDPSGSGWLQATATIDGFRFRAVEQFYSSGDWGSGYERTLYLREPCPSDLHEPAERELEVDSLAGLGAFLAHPEGYEHSWRCATCQLRHHDEAEYAERHLPTPPPPTVAQRLLDVLGEYVEGLIAEHQADRI